MHAFEFSIPTQIVFGPGTEARTGELAAGLGASRVLLVCGGQSARRSGLLDRVEQSLTQAGLICRVFAGIHPNPRLFQVREGIQAALEFGADLVLAVGGGSVIDTAKKVLYTGHIGDGKIFVYDVENAIKVRTGEEGYDALQDVE